MDESFTQKMICTVTTPAVLTTSQCDLVIHDAKKIGMKRATVLGRDGRDKRSVTRTCTSCWLPKVSEFEWLYTRVAKVIDEVNAKHFRFDINDMQELQVLRYRPLQTFMWHYDCYNGSKRKITTVINLTDKADYVGQGLRVEGEWIGVESGKDIGAASMFPAWVKHKASAPLWGERWSLVAWVTGPAWR